MATAAKVSPKKQAAEFDGQLRLIVSQILEDCPRLFVEHCVLDTTAKRYVEKNVYRRGIEGRGNAIPEGFPDFPIAHIGVFPSDHGYIHLFVYEKP